MAPPSEADGATANRTSPHAKKEDPTVSNSTCRLKCLYCIVSVFSMLNVLVNFHRTCILVFSHQRDSKKERAERKHYGLDPQHDGWIFLTLRR